VIETCHPVLGFRRVSGLNLKIVSPSGRSFQCRVPSSLRPVSFPRLSWFCSFSACWFSVAQWSLTSRWGRPSTSRPPAHSSRARAQWGSRSVPRTTAAMAKTNGTGNHVASVRTRIVMALRCALHRPVRFYFGGSLRRARMLGDCR